VNSWLDVRKQSAIAVANELSHHRLATSAGSVSSTVGVLEATAGSVRIIHTESHAGIVDGSETQMSEVWFNANILLGNVDGAWNSV
jgi:hypothetical protein